MNTDILQAVINTFDIAYSCIQDARDEEEREILEDQTILLIEEKLYMLKEQLNDPVDFN